MLLINQYMLREFRDKFGAFVRPVKILSQSLSTIDRYLGSQACSFGENRHVVL